MRLESVRVFYQVYGLPKRTQKLAGLTNGFNNNREPARGTIGKNELTGEIQQNTRRWEGGDHRTGDITQQDAKR